ncbi:MAG: alkaline phosphatase D family protein [Bacteroidota bacterium]
MKNPTLLLLLIPNLLLGQQADEVRNKRIATIAFGSCSKQEQVDDQLWEEVNNTEPDLWIWLGDNIYGDSEDRKVLRDKYDLQKSHKGYQKLLSQTEVLGIWDDHDYGVNDGGSEYPSKDASKDELFRFLDVTSDHPARGRKGAYQSYTYESGKRTKIIFLDARYFRDSLKWDRSGPWRKKAIINPTGQVLGQEQWSWLEEQLSEEDIDLFIVCTGIQAIPEEHIFEKWANFPVERERLFKTLGKTSSPLIILSGDRHMSEVSRLDLQERKHPIYEFTSSSLVSSWGMEEEEPKRYREKDIVFQPNFALLDVTWADDTLKMELNYFGKDNQVFQTHVYQFRD